MHPPTSPLKFISSKILNPSYKDAPQLSPAPFHILQTESQPSCQQLVKVVICALLQAVWQIFTLPLTAVMLNKAIVTVVLLQ